MDDVQKCLSLANVLAFQSTIKKYECECYSKYLEEVKGDHSKETDSIKQIHKELEPLQTKRRNLDSAKTLLVKTFEELEELKQDQEALIHLEEMKLRSILTEGEKMLSHYNNKLAEMNKALQSCPQVEYALRLENQIARSEFDIRKNDQQTSDLNTAIGMREQFTWQREKMYIVEFAQLMLEESRHEETMLEIQTEIERLTRETELEKSRVRREPALKPLKVFVAPEAPARISPPQLTPLMDLMQSEEIPYPCSVQTQDCTLNESLEPPAKIPRRSATPRFSQFSLRQRFMSLFSSSPAEDRVEYDGSKNKTSDFNAGLKKIKLLDQQVLSKNDTQSIIETTHIERLRNVDAISSVRVGSETGLLRICNDDTVDPAVEGAAAAPPAAAITPPTQFQDMAAMGPVAIETQSHAELDESLVNPSYSEASARVNETCDGSMDIDLSNMEFTPLRLSDMSQAKGGLVKKLNSTPDFLYSTKKKEQAVTSKFFLNAELSAEEDGRDAPRARESAVSAPEHTSMEATSMEHVQEVMETAEGCSEAAANDDLSLKQVAPSELDDSTYDFTSMLVTPSLLLSPTSDEPAREMSDQPIPSTSLFGGEKRAFLLPGASGEDAAAEPSAPAPFSFNFHEKKRGFFSLFN